jgi:hypothetical protein
LEIKTNSIDDSFTDLIKKFQVNDFSDEVRSRAISMAEHAFQDTQSK